MAYKEKTVKNYKDKSTGYIHISKRTVMKDFEDLVVSDNGEYTDDNLVGFALISKPNDTICYFQADFVLSRIIEE